MRPLTIAYRGNWRVNWTTETHVTWALESLGHKVIRLQENSVGWRDVERQARKADVFLWQRTWNIEPEQGLEVLAHLADAGIPTVSFHLDLYIGLEREAQIRDNDPFWRTSLVVTADGGHAEEFAAYGINHHWLPPGVHGPDCKSGRADRRRFPHDVVFVGSHPYPHPVWRDYRDELIATMERHFGDRFKVWPEKNRPLRGQALNDLYASAKVVVGDSCLAGQVPFFWSDRIPETLGRGGVLLHPEVEGLDEWYEHGRDLVTYPVGDFDAAVRHVEHLLEDDELRERIRGQGQGTVMARDTYAHRMTSVLEVLEDLKPERPAESLKVAAHHPRSRARASFVLAQGDTDAVAVQEVWQNDDYKLTPPDVRGKTVVDIGANVGAFSVLAARMGAKAVHAYEPHPANAAALRANIAANRVKVDVIEAAVLDRVYANAVQIGGDGGGATLTAGDGPEVRVVPIVEAINVAAGTAGTLGLLKIDVEGSEYRIFSGHPEADPELWLPRVERIVMEFHGPHMPHLAVLDDGQHLRRWGAMVAMLADYGRVEIFGHPRVGGLLWWRRY